MSKIMDFRSDTVTKPSQEMREYISKAEVGDDIYEDDPTSNELNDYVAHLTGKEAAIYTCSGTMGNLLAFLSAGKPGESILAGKRSHIWNAEVGGLSAIAGLCPYPLNDDNGIPSPEEIVSANRADGNIHHPQTTILTLENTHNFTGGIAVSPELFAKTAQKGKELGFHVHIDGARIFNAATYYKTTVKKYADEVDSIQFCLSKGLGAPMGSMLCGTKKFIENAKRWRKRLGGAQRQLGIVAAAGLYALKHNISKLEDDHANALLLAELLKKGKVQVENTPNMTNMVFFALPSTINDETFVNKCKNKNLLLQTIDPGRVRLVTHLDVTKEDCIKGASIILEVLSECA
ncbi:MAG: GntG family PLP-dependent aldolase [Synergistaceae bacterium]